MNFKSLIFLLVFCILLLFGVSFFFSHQDPDQKDINAIIRGNTMKDIVRNDEIISDVFMEASPFVWKGKLKYFISERDERDSNKKFHELAIYDFETRKRESSFGKGLGLASAAVIDNTLYVTATKDWFNFGKSEIYLIKSYDLKTFTEPELIYKADENEKIFNTTIVKNIDTGKFVIAYESHDDKSIPFTIYFLESEDGIKWQKTNAVFGKDIYVACPTIKYFDGYYYMNYSMIDYFDPNCLDCRSYVTKIARSKDLKKWETSMQNLMVTARIDEGINTSDVDFIEYNRRIYFFYAIGDQSKWGGMKYAIFDGTLRELLARYFPTNK